MEALLKTAREEAEAAVYYDARGEAREALTRYRDCVELFLRVLQDTSCPPQLRNTLQVKCAEYLTRAEQLQTHRLPNNNNNNNNNSRPPAVVVQSNNNNNVNVNNNNRVSAPVVVTPLSTPVAAAPRQQQPPPPVAAAAPSSPSSVAPIASSASGHSGERWADVFERIFSLAPGAEQLVLTSEAKLEGAVPKKGRAFISKSLLCFAPVQTEVDDKARAVSSSVEGSVANFALDEALRIPLRRVVSVERSGASLRVTTLTGVIMMRDIANNDFVTVLGATWRNVLNETRVFGVDIEVLCRRDGESVPRIVEALVSDLEDRGLTVDGLFVGSSPSLLSEANRIASELDAGNEVDFSSLEDVRTVAALLKKFFRELPLPLLRPAWGETTGLSEIRTTAGDPAARMQLLKALVALLPEANRRLYKYLVFFFAAVAGFSDQNKMTAKIIGVTFAEILAGKPDGLPVNANAFAQAYADFIEMSISERRSIF